MNEPIVVNAALAVLGLLGIGSFLTLRDVRDQVRDLHTAVFGPERGVLAVQKDHEKRLNRHSDALRALGGLED